MNRNLLIGGGILLVVILAFFYFRGGSATVENSLQAGGTTSEINAFLRQVSAVRSINLNRAVFENSVLTTGLKDQSRELPPEEKGRTNPFAPISAGSGTNYEEAQPVETTQTAAPAKKVLSD